MENKTLNSQSLKQTKARIYQRDFSPKIHANSHQTQNASLNIRKCNPSYCVSHKPYGTIASKIKRAQVSKEVEKFRHVDPIGRLLNGDMTVENGMEFPQKIKNRAITPSRISTSGYIFTRIKTRI